MLPAFAFDTSLESVVGYVLVILFALLLLGTTLVPRPSRRGEPEAANPLRKEIDYARRVAENMTGVTITQPTSGHRVDDLDVTRFSSDVLALCRACDEMHEELNLLKAELLERTP